MAQPRNLAVVAGNGLSMACTSELALGNLTEDLLEKFENLSTGDPNVTASIRQISQRIERDDEFDSNDFEKLVGAFDTQGALLAELRGMCAAIEVNPLALLGAINTVESFTQKVRHIGVGFVLQTILDRTRGSAEKCSPLIPFMKSLVSDFSGFITFGNLNYDGLVISAMREANLPLCDMASGKTTYTVQVPILNADGTANGMTRDVIVRPLRTDIDEIPTEPQYRVRLIHPHGSLSYFKNHQYGHVVKFKLEDVRNYELLSPFRYPERFHLPSVVLTNSSEKSRVVEEEPFKLAYEVLEKGLIESDHWLIVGYSFRDRSINQLLAKIYRRKRVRPKILVSTYRDDLQHETIKDAFGFNMWEGFPPGDLIVNRDGVEGLAETWDWGMFRLE